MGNKYTVMAWVQVEGVGFRSGELHYQWLTIYSGEYLLKALWVLWGANKQFKAGCSKLEVR